MNHIVPGRSAGVAGGGDGATRNRFFRGKRMKAEDYILEQTYGMARRRLVNRAVLGSGIVYGFSLPEPQALAAGSKPLAVGPGFALDGCGRELLTACSWTLDAHNTFLMPPEGDKGCPHDLKVAEEGRYLLRVHYAEWPDAFMRVGECCGCEPAEANLVHETVLFSLEPWGDRPVPDACCCPPAGACDGSRSDGGDAAEGGGCGCWTCRDEGRGCGCGADPCDLAEAWTAQPPEPCHGSLCGWRGREVALADGIPLGVVVVEARAEACGALSLKQVEPGRVRPIVKNNQLLYDLLPRCLTRIVDTTWKAYHRAPDPMPWADFQALLIPDKASPDGITNLAFTLSGPVRPDSVTPYAVAVTVILANRGTRWRRERRIPVVDVASDGPSVFRIVVEPEWIEDEIADEASSDLEVDEFLVEIVIRGDFITDLSGRSVDGEPKGATGLPSGNGTPGGTFLSCFRVMAKPASQRPPRRPARGPVP